MQINFNANPVVFIHSVTINAKWPDNRQTLQIGHLDRLPNRPALLFGIKNLFRSEIKSAITMINV